MITILSLKIVFKLRKPRKGRNYEEVVTKPVLQGADHVKLAIARVLERWEDKAVYYYVIAEMEREGVKAFRTIIPKTLL